MPKTKTKEVAVVPVPQQSARKLQEVEQELAEITETFNRHVKDLEERREILRENLLLAMKKTGVKSIKLENGDVYARVHTTKFEVTDTAKAFQWGTMNNCLRLDMVKARTLLTRLVGVPEGFEQVESEHISVRRNHE